MPRQLTNWAGNVTFNARQVHSPTSVEQLQEVVAGARSVRALGTMHSFNAIADTAGDLVSVSALPKDVVIDEDASTALVSGGLRYGEIGPRLHAAGFALRNLGSLPHISVAGACATGTHGSGQTNGSLASAVRAIEMVTADGELVRLRRGTDDETFCGAVVALGCLGVVTTLTLDLVPSFDVRQYVYDDLPIDQLTANLDAILGAAYSVSLFTDWRGSNINQVWVKHQVGPIDAAAEPRWMGAALATGARHPLRGMPVANCTEQLGIAGPWYERLPHFRLEFVPSAGDELQSEYLLPRRHALAAFDAVHRIADRIAPVLLISEIRTVAADDLWLSTAYGYDAVAFHFTWVKDEAAVRPVLAAIEEQLAPFGARPHWGKLFSTEPGVIRGRYEHFADFEALARRLDPTGKFRNAFVDRYFPGP